MPTEEKPASAEPSEKRTPAEWAELKGIAPKANYPWEEAVSSDWRYPAAAQLHGWTHDAYNYQAHPFKLLEKDFDAALAAAAEYPVKPEHEAAVAPHAPFKPIFAAAKKAREEAAAAKQEKR